MNTLLEEERQRLKYEEDEWGNDEFGENESDDATEPDEFSDSISRVN